MLAFALALAMGYDYCPGKFIVTFLRSYLVIASLGPMRTIPM